MIAVSAHKVPQSMDSVAGQLPLQSQILNLGGRQAPGK